MEKKRRKNAIAGVWMAGLLIGSVFLYGTGTTLADTRTQTTAEGLCRSLGYVSDTASWAHCVLLNNGSLEKPPFAYGAEIPRATIIPLAKMTFLALSRTPAAQPQSYQSMSEAEQRAKAIQRELRKLQREQASQQFNHKLIEYGLRLMMGDKTESGRVNRKPVTCFAQPNGAGGYIVNCD